MPGYKVTDSKELAGMTQAGGEHKYYRVWLLTDRGATGHIDVELADWTEEKLPTILQEKAKELDLAFNLSGLV